MGACSTASTSRSSEGSPGIAPMTTDVNRRVLPGFSLSLGYTLLYMSLLVAIPLAAGVLKAAHLPFSEFWAAIASEPALAAYRLTVGAAPASAVITVAVGVLVAGVRARYAVPPNRL